MARGEARAAEFDCGMTPPAARLINHPYYSAAPGGIQRPRAVGSRATPLSARAVGEDPPRDMLNNNFH